MTSTAKGAEVGRTRDLVILDERVLVEIPRPRTGEALRVTLVRAQTRDGSEVEWVAIRLFFRDSRGAMRPAKSGCTVRMRELGAVISALMTADAAPAASRERAAPAAAAAAPARPVKPSSRQARLPGVRLQTSQPFKPPPPPPDLGIDDAEIF